MLRGNVSTRKTCNNNSTIGYGLNVTVYDCMATTMINGKQQIQMIKIIKVVHTTQDVDRNSLEVTGGIWVCGSSPVG